MERYWSIPKVRGAEVRVKSRSRGHMSLEANAPVRSGSLMIDPSAVTLDLVIALEKMRMTSVLLQWAARGIFSMHRVQDLSYRGVGQRLDSVHGIARAGDIEVPLSLALSISGPELELVGSASMGRVHIPLPGLGTIDDFSFDVDARLALQRD